MRASWPALAAAAAATSRSSAARTEAAGVDIGVAGGPELGLACELMLAEMHVDRALSLARQQPSGGASSGAAASESSSPVGSVMGAAAGGSAAVSVSVAAAVDGTGAGGGSKKGNEAPSPTTVPSAVGVGGKVEAAGLRQRPKDRLHREASRHLAAVDGAMVLLEPWFLCLEGRDGEERACVREKYS